MSQSHQLVGRERQDTEHQVAHDFGRPLNPDVIAAELILEPAIGAFGDRPLVVTEGIDRIELFLLAVARVVIDERYVVQAAAVFVQFSDAQSLCPSLHPY